MLTKFCTDFYYYYFYPLILYTNQMGVGLVDNRPSTEQLNHLVKKEEEKKSSHFRLETQSRQFVIPSIEGKYILGQVCIVFILIQLHFTAKICAQGFILSSFSSFNFSQIIIFNESAPTPIQFLSSYVLPHCNSKTEWN